jgi:hypothetical protein
LGIQVSSVKVIEIAVNLMSEHHTYIKFKEPPVSYASVGFRTKQFFFSSEMKQSEEDVAPIAMPKLYKLPSGASDMHTLATLEIDESTIDGNIAVLEALATDPASFQYRGIK